jgi:hypothetical protein
MTLTTERTCKIVRVYTAYKWGRTEVVKRGLTYDQAVKHCRSRATISRTAKSKRAVAHTKTHGAWFDGWDWE